MFKSPLFFKSQRRSERKKAGLARIVAMGKKIGSPKGSKDRRKRKIKRVYKPGN
jgi:DNA invertase Pin-like site-specific DNA recombinase